MRQFETEQVQWRLVEQLQRCDLSADDLVIPLRAFGVTLDVDQARALATSPGPAGIDFAVLAGLCHVLRCDAADLIDGPHCRPLSELPGAASQETVTFETGPHAWLPEVLETVRPEPALNPGSVRGD